MFLLKLDIKDVILFYENVIWIKFSDILNLVYPTLHAMHMLNYLVYKNSFK